MTPLVRNVVLGAGALVLAGAGFGAYRLNHVTGPGADVSIIAHGERVELAEHTVPGKYTVFDFYAVWCPPCRALSPALERLASRHTDRLAARKVDIVDWTMPVAEQYKIEELPFMVLYDASGKRLADGDAVYDELHKVIGAGPPDVQRASERQGSTSM